MSDLEDEGPARGPDRKRVRFGGAERRAVSPGDRDDDNDDDFDDPLARKGRKRRLPVADSEDMPQDDAFLQEVGRALRDDDEDDDGGGDGEKKGDDSEDEGSDEGGEASGARTDRDKRVANKLTRSAEDKLQQQKIRLDEGVKGETSLSRDANAGATIEKFDMGGYWDEDGKFVDEDEEEGQEADEFVRGLVQQKAVTEDLAKPRQAQPKPQQRKTPTLPDDPMALKRILLSRMEPGENVLKSLARLKPKVAKTAKKHGYGKKDKSANVVVGSLDTAEARAAARDARLAEAEKKMTEDERERQSDFDMITEAAQALLAAGDYDIYQATYENLQKALAAHRGAGAGRGRPPSAPGGPPSRPAPQGPASSASASSSPSSGLDMFAPGPAPSSGPAPPRPSVAVTWEYKWNDAQTHGPYSGEQMMAWRDQGYFDKALVRRLEPFPSDWVQSSRTTNFLS